MTESDVKRVKETEAVADDQVLVYLVDLDDFGYGLVPMPADVPERLFPDKASVEEALHEAVFVNMSKQPAVLHMGLKTAM